VRKRSGTEISVVSPSSPERRAKIRLPFRPMPFEGACLIWRAGRRCPSPVHAVQGGGRLGDVPAHGVARLAPGAAGLERGPVGPTSPRLISWYSVWIFSFCALRFANAVYITSARRDASDGGTSDRSIG